MESRMSRDLAENLDRRPRSQPDEAQQRQQDRHQDGLDGAHPDDAEGREHRQRELHPIEPVEFAQRLQVEERQRRLDQHAPSAAIGT